MKWGSDLESKGKPILRTYTHTHTYIYIYIYIICVCVYTKKDFRDKKLKECINKQKKKKKIYGKCIYLEIRNLLVKIHIVFPSCFNCSIQFWNFPIKHVCHDCTNHGET